MKFKSILKTPTPIHMFLLIFHAIFISRTVLAGLDDYPNLPKSYKENKHKHHVEIITAKNIEEKVLSSNDLWILEFVTDKCYHCRMNIDIFRGAAMFFRGENLKGTSDLKVKFGAVDSKKLEGKYGIINFPTMMAFGSDKKNPKIIDTKNELKKYGQLTRLIEKIRDNIVQEKSEHEMVDKIQEVKNRIDANLDADKKMQLHQAVKRPREINEIKEVFYPNF